MKLTDTIIAKLIQDQFPFWANLEINQHHHFGTDNAIFRLGTNMGVRLPKIESSAMQIKKEQCWLSRLESHLPLTIPVPIENGKPSEEYPYNWYIYHWIEGQNTYDKIPRNLKQVAKDLADFIIALHTIPANGAPNTRRGLPLKSQDKEVLKALSNNHIKDLFDTRIIISIWEEILNIPNWDKALVWIHGDLLPSNLLVQNDKLNAVIDFGLMGIGDPACDLIPAWSLFDANSRSVFRNNLKIDDNTWMRGKGWALSIALVIIPFYQNNNPVLMSVAKHMINEIIIDRSRNVSL